MDDGTWWRGLADFPGIRRGLPLIAAAALAGPFVARTLYTYSIRHIRVSRAAIINQAQPLFVALFSLILLQTLPSRREWTGGLLIIGGALVLVRWRAGMAWWRHVVPHHPPRFRRRRAPKDAS
jgi:drug/metabolite transporter (DMT)-like permease